MLLKVASARSHTELRRTRRKEHYGITSESVPECPIATAASNSLDLPTGYRYLRRNEPFDSHEQGARTEAEQTE